MAFFFFCWRWHYRPQRIPRYCKKKSRHYFWALSKNYEKRVLAWSLLSWVSAWNNSAPLWTNFHEIWYLNSFYNFFFVKTQVSLKSDKNKSLYMNTNIHFWSYLARFFLEWEMFRTKVVEKIKTHIVCSVTFYRKSCRLWENEEKDICRAGAGHTDDNMAHALCMLYN